MSIDRIDGRRNIKRRSPQQAHPHHRVQLQRREAPSKNQSIITRGYLIGELVQRPSVLAICAAFLVSGGWIIYQGGGYVVYLTTTLCALTMGIMEIHKNRH